MLQTIKTFLFLAIVVGSLAITGTGCNTNGDYTTSGSTLPDTVAKTGVTITSATFAECSTGGSVIEIFEDTAGTGIFQSSDPVISRSAICNGAQGLTGATGAQGNGAGITIVRASSAACSAGGDLITTFIDANNNGVLDSNEVTTSISTVCNGINGTNGDNGTSAHITVTAASTSVCPAGGAIYTSFEDNQAPTSTTLCNGEMGVNGTNGTQVAMGALGPQIPNQPYSACHHDYIYIPGNNGARGWLVFRHQFNGSADQGIGNSGFQVWNADISDFLLVSENGVAAETYCSVHWDPAAKLMSFSVQDANDGMQGFSGQVQF